MGLRQTDDAGRTAAEAPASPREDTARIGPRAREAGEPREETRRRYQEEREERPDWRLQDSSQGPRSHEEIYSEVLPDANATASNLFENSGGFPNNSCPSSHGADDGTRQTVRSNEQMMQSMKGATMLLGSMNRQMNLPALQRIAMEFERENDIMDQRQEMMDDAIDDVTGLEDEEEGEEVVNQVLDEIGVDLNNAVSFCLLALQYAVLT